MAFGNPRDNRWKMAGEFDALADVLAEALAQAASGKGAERHGNGKNFLSQPIMEMGRMLGPAGPAFQVMKKTQEAAGMARRGSFASAKREMLGAIVYSSALVLLFEEMELETANVDGPRTDSHQA